MTRAFSTIKTMLSQRATSHAVGVFMIQAANLGGILYLAWVLSKYDARISREGLIWSAEMWASAKQLALILLLGQAFASYSAFVVVREVLRRGEPEVEGSR